MIARIRKVVGRVGPWRAIVLAAMHPLSVEGQARSYARAARLCAKLGVRRTRVSLNDARVFVDPRSYFALRHLIVSRYYDIDQIDAVRAAVPGEWTFLDIGANFGSWTFPLSRHFSRVLAAEPDPRCLDCLTRSKDALPAENVTLFGGAVSDTDGEVELAMDEMHTGDSRIYAAVDPGRKTVRVPMRTVDSLLEEQGLSPERLFIKIDIQGAEPLAVRGMRGTLSRVREAVYYTELVAEPLADAGSSAEAYLDLLSACGFHPVRLEPGFPEIAWDELPEWMASHKDCCFRLVRTGESA